MVVVRCICECYSYIRSSSQNSGKAVSVVVHCIFSIELLSLFETEKLFSLLNCFLCFNCLKLRNGNHLSPSVLGTCFLGTKFRTALSPEQFRSVSRNKIQNCFESKKNLPELL
jgi:hypothetical protein